MGGNPAWKDDFPISWVDDHYVTRREFTRSMALVSCAAFAATGTLAALGAGRGDLRGTPTRVAGVEDLPVGGWRVFAYPGPGDPCLLVRLDRDRFVAYSQKCTHLGCPVVFRAGTGKLYCPCHEGYFAAEDGRVLAGPPPRPLPKVDLER
ncbi:MAG: ubiquinol-cytochrome c reductase iron-sulfur subunit, partial [Candidatus Rokuibacteriota bacterium]